MRVILFVFATAAVLCLSGCARTEPDASRPDREGAGGGVPNTPGEALGEPLVLRPAPGEADIPPMTCTARRMRGNPTIDADWDKPAWRDAEPVTLTYYMGEAPAYTPRVQAKVAYDDDYLYVIWRVEDRYVIANLTEHGQAACMDSCVEFFFTPDPNADPRAYLNLETSCLGKMWFAAQGPGTLGKAVTPEDLEQVAIAGSITQPIHTEIKTPLTWTLEYRIPLALLERYAPVVRPAPGAAWRANFYKCAESSSHKHYLTWAPVIWRAPQFHMPGYFGTLVFE